MSLAEKPGPSPSPADLGLSLVCVSGGGGTDFEVVRAWCERVLESLRGSGTLGALVKAASSSSPLGVEYGVEALNVPGLRHFVYKSRVHVQITHPSWGERYAEEDARRR